MLNSTFSIWASCSMQTLQIRLHQGLDTKFRKNSILRLWLEIDINIKKIWLKLRGWIHFQSKINRQLSKVINSDFAVFFLIKFHISVSRPWSAFPIGTTIPKYPFHPPFFKYNQIEIWSENIFIEFSVKTK